MGGARNLKLGDNGRQSQATGEQEIFLVSAKCKNYSVVCIKKM